MHSNKRAACCAIAASVAVSLTGTSACKRYPEGNTGVTAQSVSAIVDSISSEFALRSGESIGMFIEARYLGTRHAVVLDKYPPHLRLFSNDGVPIWAGVSSGGGPGELDKPQALGAGDSIVVVLQRGRIDQWRLVADTLAFLRSTAFPIEFFPFGIVPACGADWLIYARNDRQLPQSLSEARSFPTIDYLHKVTLDTFEPTIEPLWTAQLDPSIYVATGHAASLISRVGERIAVWHRPNHRQAGQIVELNCSGEVLFSTQEGPLVTGDSLPVIVPRPQPLEWTAGIAAVQSGVIVAMHRYFSKLHHGVDASHWKTEVFALRQGQYKRSVILEGQWIILDSDATLGILIATTDPIPHFIRLPANLIIDGIQGAAAQ